MALKQYTPLTNLSPKDGDVTIIGAHANGFPKVPQVYRRGLLESDFPLCRSYMSLCGTICLGGPMQKGLRFEIYGLLMYLIKVPAVS